MQPRQCDLPVEEKLLHDPFSLDHDERNQLLEQNRGAQSAWLPVLARLVEPPAPDATFPAFLLETEAFTKLRRAIGEAQGAGDLDTATADEVQRFVDCYRDYLA